MKFLDKSDFVFQTNIANLMSPVATFTAPLSQMYSILDNFPYLLAITAYQAFTVATPTSAFTVTTTYPIAVPTDSNGNSLYSITAVAYDVTNNTLPPVTPTSITGNEITFPAIAGSAANDSIGVWYRLLLGTWRLYVQSGTTKSVSYTIIDGAIAPLNLTDQWDSRTMRTFPQKFPLAPADRLILAVKTPATVQMSSLSIATGFKYDINTASFLRLPVDVVNQPS